MISDNICKTCKYRLNQVKFRDGTIDICIADPYNFTEQESIDEIAALMREFAVANLYPYEKAHYKRIVDINGERREVWGSLFFEQFRKKMSKNCIYKFEREMLGENVSSF